MKWLRKLLVLIVVAATFAWGYHAWTQRPIPDFGRQILVFSKTTAYRHDAIPTGIKAITELGRREKFNVVATEDATLFNDEYLKQIHAVVFLNTTGDVLDNEQQVSFERYIQAGGGFVGIHSAADTEWRENPWYWYQRLVGGVFISHPESSDQPAELAVVGAHASVATLPATWRASDEWYDFQRLSDDTQVLLTVDEATYEGGQMGEQHPIVWYRDFDGGRSFYIGLGHTSSTYKNKHFLDLLRGGLEYAMGGELALDYSKARPEPWRYTRVVLDSGLDEPLKLAFSPAGDLYFVQRGGALRRYDAQRQTSVTVAQLDVFTEQEYGLVGLAFDPDFASNHWLYLFRTLPAGDAGRNVLSRFKLVDHALDISSEQELLSIPVDGNSSLRAAHTGGDMQFDNQGNLWLSTGDDTNPGDQSLIDDRPGQTYRDAARSSGNTMDLRGKILRITPTDKGGYTVPEGNLFAADSNAGRPEIYVMGLRNPYTIAYNDRTETVYWGDIGPDGKAHVERGSWGFDEVNRTNKPGNFGWPYAIGDNQPYTYYDYDSEQALDTVDIDAPENRSRNNTGAKVLPPAQPAWIYYPYDYSDTFWELGTGGRNALVAPLFYSEDYAESDVKFPAFMDGKLIVSDFIRRWLNIVSTDVQGNVQTITPLINTPLSAPLDMAFGPDGALYVVEYGTNWFMANEDSFISRIEFYAGDNPPPVAVATAEKLVGAAPLETVLDASTSYDRGAGPVELSYLWRLIESGKAGKELGTLAQQPIALTEIGEHQIELVVTDAEGSSSATRLRFVVGNERPEVQLDISGNRSFYFNEGGFDYSVAVVDLEDGSTEAGTVTAAEVNVLFDYIGQSEDLARALSGRTSDAALEGRALALRGSDCHACHALDGESVGPSFTAIAQRYFGEASSGENSADYLVDVISAGGSGQWDGGHAMPAHPDLNEPKLRQLVAFIRSLAGSVRAGGGGMPLSGSIQFDRHLNDSVAAIVDEIVTVDLGLFYPGSYVLHASYTDQGSDGVEPLQGGDTIVLRNARVSPANFDADEGLITFAVGDAMSLGIYRYPSEALPSIYGMMEAIDLTGISAVRIQAVAMRPMMGGGPLELRLGSPDAEPVATQQIKASFSTDPDEATFDIDVSTIEGVHDIYFTTSASDGSGQLAFSLVSMEFLR